MTTATEPYVLNIGPQHPSTHGVFRLRVVMDGERIQDADMVVGYLHRSMEKLAESAPTRRTSRSPTAPTTSRR